MYTCSLWRSWEEQLCQILHENWNEKREREREREKRREWVKKYRDWKDNGLRTNHSDSSVHSTLLLLSSSFVTIGLSRLFFLSLQLSLSLSIFEIQSISEFKFHSSRFVFHKKFESRKNVIKWCDSNFIQTKNFFFPLLPFFLSFFPPFFPLISSSRD